LCSLEFDEVCLFLLSTYRRVLLRNFSFRRLPLDFEVAHLSREKVVKYKLYVPGYIFAVLFVVCSLLVPIYGAVCRLGQTVWIISRRASISMFNIAIRNERYCMICYHIVFTQKV
jgi:hypothetical protein